MLSCRDLAQTSTTGWIAFQLGDDPFAVIQLAIIGSYHWSGGILVH